MGIAYSKRRINRVRLPILVVIAEKMNFSLSPFAPENYVCTRYLLTIRVKVDLAASP